MTRLVRFVWMLALLASALAPTVQAEFINGDLTVAGYINYCAATGTTNTYACALPSAITQYRTGGCYAFLANTTNTGAATLNLNGLGPQPITKFVAGSLAELAAGDIGAGQIVAVCYDGTTLQLRSGSGGGGGSSNFSTLTSGTNTTAAMVVGSGASIIPVDSGQVRATSMPPTGLTAPVPDELIPDLNTLSTGLTPLKCVATDAAGLFVSTGAACGTGAGGGGSFADLTSGTNTTAAMVVGSGASITPVDSGEVRATSMPPTGLTAPVPDELIPDLSTLSTGLTPARCVETNASTGRFQVAAGACNTGAGGSGTWGGITGTLSNQTDLQAALDAKVPTTRTVNGHALTSDIAVTAADLGLGSVDNTTDAQKNSATAIVTNHQIVPRGQPLTVLSGTPNHITPNLNNTDVGYTYTLTTPVTMDNPTFTAPNPFHQQLIAFEFGSAAAQALTWGSMYSNECGLELPTSTTGIVAGKQIYDRVLFRYNESSTKLCLVSSTKSDPVRVTTLAPAAAYNCPVDNSDLCEMSHTLTAGSITVDVQPRGLPANGQRLSIALRCTANQTLVWDPIFIDSPTFTRPTTCLAADNAKWLSVEARYTTVLGKWQVVRGAVPSTGVQTNQANTYTAGAQDFAAATSMTLPSSAGAAPTAAGTLAYNTTQDVPVFGENGLMTSQPTRMLYSSDAGNSNNGQTGDFLHTGATITLPAGYLLQHRSLRMCVSWRFTTLGSPGSLSLKIRANPAGVDLYTTGANATPTASRTNSTIGFCYTVVIKDAVGATANTYTAPLASYDDITAATGFNGTAQPVQLNTTIALTFVVVSRWNTPVAGNIITPDLFTVEALN